MVGFLESEGYDVSYTTDVDTHERGSLLTNHNGFLSVGHNEYWSLQMRQNVTAARDAGVGSGFLFGQFGLLADSLRDESDYGSRRSHDRCL